MTQILHLGTAISAATGASSVATAIPNNAVAAKARVVLVRVEIAAAFIRPTTSGGTVDNTNGTLVGPGDGGLLLHVAGSDVTHIAHIQQAAAGRISITSIENLGHV